MQSKMDNSAKLVTLGTKYEKKKKKPQHNVWCIRLCANKTHRTGGKDEPNFVRGIDFTSFCDFSIGFWNCSENVILVFHFNTNLHEVLRSYFVRF